MTRASHGAQAHCQIVGGDKALDRAGGGAMLCAKVERSIATHAPTANARVQIKVLPRSRLLAALVVNGHALPDQNFAVMDGGFDEGSLDRFAQSLGAAVAKAAKAR